MTEDGPVKFFLCTLGAFLGFFGGSAFIYWSDRNDPSQEGLIGGALPLGMLVGIAIGIGLGAWVYQCLERHWEQNKKKEWQRIKDKYAAHDQEPIHFDPVWPPAPKRPPAGPEQDGPPHLQAEDNSSTARLRGARVGVWLAGLGLLLPVGAFWLAAAHYGPAHDIGWEEGGGDYVLVYCGLAVIASECYALYLGRRAWWSVPGTVAVRIAAVVLVCTLVALSLLLYLASRPS